MVEPSTNSTMECTTDCGCTTTAIRSTGTSKSRCASMSSSPLFIRLAEFTVTTGPIDHVGWASACSAVTAASSARVRPRNGPPEAVRTSRETSERSPERRHCAMAECSESTGTIWSARTWARRTRSPPTTSDSLFARARVDPARSAARVGPRPTEPVMPLSTTSAPRPASTRAASGPVRTSTSGTAALRAQARPAIAARSGSSPAGSATATLDAPVARTWAASACGSAPPAASPVTTNLSGWAWTTSIAWVPIEPVEPRRVTVRGASGLMGMAAVFRVRTARANGPAATGAPAPAWRRHRGPRRAVGP